MMRMLPRSTLLLAEWFGLFILLPGLLALGALPLSLLPLPLLAGAGWLWRQGARVEPRWFLRPRPERRQWPLAVIRFALSMAVLATVVALVEPGRFAPESEAYSISWRSLLFVYPIMSVLPQELLYRPFFFRRYRALFPTPTRMIWASAFAFGWLHVLYHPVAALLAVTGGLFLAQSWYRTGSLRLVWLEHSLYGMAIFALGLGPLFDRGLVPG